MMDGASGHSPVRAAASGVPSRKALRESLRPYAVPHTVTALELIVADWALFILGLGLVAAPLHITLKLAGAVVIWIGIARLFIIGHDACHHSLTRHRRLNRWLGRIAFLPSLTPYKLWEIGHNVAHHGFTNLKGRDYVWTPFSVAEFSRLRPARQRLEKIYRSRWGHGLYYLAELWWKKLFFPNRSEVGLNSPSITADCWLVTLFGVAWVGGLAAIAVATLQSAMLSVVLGFIIPFLLWNALMGFVVYVHHTAPDMRWYADGAQWANSQPHVSSTAHIRFHPFAGALLHNIMEHPAHHVDMTIPLYNLKAAEKKLAAVIPHEIRTRQFTWSWYRECVRTCKLYDYEAGAWRPFPSML
jgi:omega-6 fatty acid desaturase (delta-12 desaturase)